MEHRPLDQIMNAAIKWIREFFERTGGKTAVLGISGGKDSAVCAALCAEALGKENVLGVLMPNGEQPDFKDAEEVVKVTGIRSMVCNIDKAYEAMCEAHGQSHDFTEQATINLAPRLRMAMLYLVAQNQPEPARVCCCSNFCERLTGYGTLWGDTVGDFAPLKNLTVSEVIGVGLALGLPRHLVCKPPADGLTGITDEEKMGFSYDEIDEYILGQCRGETLDEGSALSKRIKENDFKQDLIHIPGAWVTPLGTILVIGPNNELVAKP